MPVGLPGMCLPIWRATICAPIDKLPVTRDPTTIVTVLPLKNSACASAEDGVQDRTNEPARMLAIDNRLTDSSPACWRQPALLTVKYKILLSAGSTERSEAHQGISWRASTVAQPMSRGGRYCSGCKYLFIASNTDGGWFIISSKPLL